MESTKLTMMTETKMLQRIEQARFPVQLTPQDKKILALVAISYGLDPLMGEVSIYQGRPYVSIDGRRRKAQETDKFDGISTRPATKTEREAWGIVEGDYFFHADVFKAGCSHPFEGWGKVTGEQIRRAEEGATRHQKDPWFLPLVQDPQGMAEKRAEAKALRKAFHIPLPSLEEMGTSEETITITDVTVDKGTGEVKEEPAPPEPTQPPKGPPLDPEAHKARLHNLLDFPEDPEAEKKRLYIEMWRLSEVKGRTQRQLDDWLLKFCNVASLERASFEQYYDALQEMKKGAGAK